MGSGHPVFFATIYELPINGMTKISMDTQQLLQNWYQQPAGQYLIELEKKVLDAFLPTCFGYYLLQMGGPTHIDMTSASLIHEKIFMQPGSSAQCNVVGAAEEIPLESNSIDVMIVNHVLEFSDNPHSVLREIERVLRPEGYVIIFSFNPWGWFGLRRALTFLGSKAPWNGRYFSATRIIDWMKLLGITLLSQRRLMIIPPVNKTSAIQFLSPIDRWFSSFLWIPMSGVNVMIAKKEVSTLTPVKPSWWQRSILGVRSDILRPTTRNNHE
jgi:SAM-dependent methyltransferase